MSTGYDERKEPSQHPLTGDEVGDRIVNRDKVREGLRGKNLANAQRVIQHQFETHGFDEVFLHGWLYKYLVFLEVRALAERTFALNGMSKKEVTIHDALNFLHLIDPDSSDRLQQLWLRMIAPDTGTIRKFKLRIGTDGKPIPIYHWINRTFAKDIVAFELARSNSKELQGYDDRACAAFDGKDGEKPDPNYAQVNQESRSATLGNWFEPEESTFGGSNHEREIVEYMRSGWAHEGNRGKTPFRSALTRLMISTLILEMGGKPNGAEIRRRLNAGAYSLPYDRYPKLRDHVPEPYPIPIDERKVQRLIENYVDGLRKITEKHAGLALETKQSKRVRGAKP